MFFTHTLSHSWSISISGINSQTLLAVLFLAFGGHTLVSPIHPSRKSWIRSVADSFYVFV